MHSGRNDFPKLTQEAYGGMCITRWSTEIGGALPKDYTECVRNCAECIVNGMIFLSNDFVIEANESCFLETTRM